MKKIVLLSFVFLLFSTAVVIRFVRPVVAEETIYIRADGSVEGTDKIQRDGNVYTFTENISDSIIVERDNIVVDGADCTVEGTGSGTGIEISHRSNVTLKNIEVTNFNYGIFLRFSSNNIITGNIVSSNNFNGLFLGFSSNNIITGNTFSNNNGHGIYIGVYIGFSSNNIITGNTLSSNKYNGIYISDSSNNIIAGNIVSSNNFNGLFFSNASNNTISGNIVSSNNNYGIFLSKASNNRFYHNYLINNTGQVYKSNSINVWDDGVGKGNYWSDYEDRYPNATELDGTDIWNTPYVIDENNQDNYPLVPEFPTWTATLLILILLTVAIAIYKHRLLKTPIH